MNIKYTDQKTGKIRYHNYKSINQIVAELAQFEQDTINEYSDNYQSAFDKSDFSLIKKQAE